MGRGGGPALLSSFEVSLLLAVWVSVCVTGLILDVCVFLPVFFYLSMSACKCVAMG